MLARQDRGSRPDGGDPFLDGEVPAAVVCTVCGLSDCAGCERTVPSLGGRTPWEAPTGSAFGKLWSTARVATVDGEAFFGALPQGNLGAALGFAAVCELCAIASFLIVWFPLAYVCVPEVVVSLAMDPSRRAALVFALSLSVPVLAGLMVLLHVIWGSSLELGLRVSGVEARPTHGLRYALYACAWDLVTSPFGFVAGWLTGGFRSAFREVHAAVRIPRFATRAYLDRSRGVTQQHARTALVIAALLTGSIVVAGATALGVAIVSVLV